MKGAAAAAAAVAGGDGKEEVKVRVGTIYPVTFATTLTVVGTNNEGAFFNKIMGLLTMNASEATEWAKTELSLVQNRALLAVSSNEEYAGRGMMKGGRKQKKKDGRFARAQGTSAKAELRRVSLWSLSHRALYIDGRY